MRCKRMLGVLLSVITLLTMAVSFTAYALERAQKIVRVGWYDSAFHHRDQFGRRSGYGYEYQQRIATYTGWKYEYVEGSWSTLLEKLIAGEIDILSDVSYTPKRAEKILYSAEAMGAEDIMSLLRPITMKSGRTTFPPLMENVWALTRTVFRSSFLSSGSKNIMCTRSS